MKVVSNISEIKALRRDIKGSVGFVPTMGYLHEGHISLVKQSRIDNAATIISIYVNPSQFGPNEDFQSYPRNTERDLQMLRDEEVDIVFMPSNEEIYPQGYSTWVDVAILTDRLEGAQRPGHFKGVTTIVAKLFNIVEPYKSYFGQKDAQQALVIKKMVEDLNMNLEVIVMPTIREKDGLAMSSRNVYLNTEQRRTATVLYKALTLAKQVYQNGEKNADVIRHKITSLISAEPLAQIQYISIADARTLEELSDISSSALVSLAVKVGKTRLIDNIIL